MAKDNSKNVLIFSTAEQAILTTILYSDIFSFPLTKEELWKWLISGKKLSKAVFAGALSNLKNKLVFKNGYFCLKGREVIIERRVKNLSEVTKKRRIAERVAQKLAHIPSVLFIGISGGLAAGNVLPEDDIDFVIIVKENTLFITRLFILGILECLGVRRSRNQKDTSDTICVNLIFDETSLSWFAKTQDLYTARELAQIIPLFERDAMYQRFMTANNWIERFLPNSMLISSLSKQNSMTHDMSIDKKRGEMFLYKIVNNLSAEIISRVLQISFMKRHRTREVLSKNLLAFHPIDYRTKTLRMLRLKMRQLGLLTNF